MNNPIIMLVQQMMQQGAGNIQAYANGLLQNNPEFAKAIQGQNLSKLGMDMLAKNGIRPDQISNMFGGKK